MPFSKEELLIAADAADKFPPYYGESWYSYSYAFP